MGELLLCNEPIAAMPYYVEGIGVNLYSMEELCYYIMHNVYLIDEDFMDDELCEWIQNELGKEEFGLHLQEIRKAGCSLWEFVYEILKESAYCSKDEVDEIRHALYDMQQKSDFECCKIRADRLFEMKKYIASIYEYKELLKQQDKCENQEIIGNVWHNLGTAYSRLFLFHQAAECYQKAYENNHNMESLKEALLAFLFDKNDKEFELLAKSCGYSEFQIQKWKEELEQELEKHKNANVSLPEDAEKLQAQICQWKEEYREICRV